GGLRSNRGTCRGHPREGTVKMETVETLGTVENADTQLTAARRGLVTPPMRRVAERENVTPEFVRDEVARGRMIIPANVNHLAKRLDPTGISKSVTTKVNVNLGNSAIVSGVDEEIAKVRLAEKLGADTIM